MSVFPAFGIVTDLDFKIFSYLNPQSVVSFSATHSHSHKVLSNDIFFKKLFQVRYPAASNCGKTLKNLVHFHPLNCWKVACCFFTRGFSQKPPSAFIQAIPQILQSLQAQITEYELDLVKICGRGEDDNDSPINQITREYQEAKKAFYDSGMGDYERIYSVYVSEESKHRHLCHA